MGQWDDRGDLQAAGEALVTALRAQEDSRAISRGAAGILALCGLGEGLGNPLSGLSGMFTLCGLFSVVVAALSSLQSTLHAVAFARCHPAAFCFTVTCAAHCCIPTHPGPLSASFLSACQLTLLQYQATQTMRRLCLCMTPRRLQPQQTLTFPAE